MITTGINSLDPMEEIMRAGENADPLEQSIEIEVDMPDDEEDALEGETEPLPEFSANLADHIDSQELAKIAGDLLTDYQNDLNSRRDWEDTYGEGLKLLGLKYEERSEPWDGASGVFSPILTEAVVRFQSETIMETFPAAGPVKTKVLGKQTVEKQAAARRVQEDMNHQLVDVMVEYRPEHEKMLWNLPFCGSAFKKVYFDHTKQRQTAIFIPAEDVILPYGTSEIFDAPRITHRMRKSENEITKLQESGFYRDINIGSPSRELEDIQEQKDRETGFTAIYDTRFTILEFQVELNIKGFEHTNSEGKQTGIALPYIVSVLKDSGEVLSVYRNWKEDDATYQRRQHFVHYQYIPGFGAYGFGLVHLIGNTARAATSLTRQLIDAGTLANLPGGLKSRGLRIKGDDTPIAPGEFRDVDVASGTVRDNIMPLPYKEPSQALIVLLGSIVEEARRFASTADLKISDMSAQAPVGTTLALLERMLKTMSAVQARIHYSMKQELRLLADIIRDNTSETYDYDVEDPRGPQAKDEDYEYTEIIPVSDPNAATMSQRVVQYQAVIQLSQMAPQIYDQKTLHREMLEVIGIKNAQKIVPLEEDMKPMDPITENMNIINMKPVKAFAYQDHEAHMAAHQAFMQDPKIAMTMGQNPQAQMMQAAMMAHIAQHTAFSYRMQVEQQLGVPLPPLDEDGTCPISPEEEAQTAAMLAQAAQQTAQINAKNMATMQAQQQMQNPELQLQQMELNLKKMEMDRKAMNDKFDFELGQERLKVERERMALDAKKTGIKLVTDSHNKAQDRELKKQLETVKILNNNQQQREGRSHQKDSQVMQLASQHALSARNQEAQQVKQTQQNSKKGGKE